MWGWGWMFWMLPLMYFGMFWGWGWRRHHGRSRRERYGGGMSDQDHAVLVGELDDQRAYAESLETRLAQLEERLDFAERLLSGRRESVSQP